MKGRSFDVCIIGGGPAGLSAAYTLASANVNVALVIDRDTKIINAGETLHPNAIDSLQKLDLLSEFQKLNFERIAGFESSWGSSRPQFKSSIQIPGGAGWLFHRTAFEDMLLKQFEEKGGSVFAGHFKLTKANKWYLTFDRKVTGSTISASFLIIATGRKSFNNSQFSHRHVLDKLICYTMQFPSEDDDMTVRLDAFEQGWLYTVKNNNGLRIVSLFTDGDLFRERDASTIVEHLSGLIRYAPSVGKIAKPTAYDSTNIKVTVSSANTTCLERAYGDDWLSCGDYAQTYDPLSSQGISYALMSGIEAASSIIELLTGLNGALEFYELSRKIRFREYLNQRNTYYNIEKRWQYAEFWSRRM